MTEQQATARFPEAAAISSPGSAFEAAPAAPASSDGSADRPELMIVSAFAGGFLTAKILKRIATR